MQVADEDGSLPALKAKIMSGESGKVVLESDCFRMEIQVRSSRNSVSLLVCTVIAVFLGLVSSLEGQEIASSDLPDPPVPEFSAVEHALMRAHPAYPTVKKNRWLSLNKLSIAALLGGEELDSWSTYSNLTHQKWICGYSPAFGNAVTYISNDGQHYDAETIQNVLCGPGPSGQAANYAYDVTRTGAFTETGWVTKLGLAGKRNFAGVEAWNLADDVGQFLIARYLGRRKGPIRRFGAGMNFSRGMVHMECGILNIRFARQNSNPNRWGFHVPDEGVLYAGPRWWGRE